MANLKSYTAQFLAFVNGDDAEVLAQKNFRQSQSGITAHIASYKADLIDVEQGTKDAEQALVEARVNRGVAIKDKADRASYVRGLLSARDNVTAAKEKEDELKEDIAFLEAELKG